jgi:trans-2,3-dihydro-3-hydroxyanthranilate isomerase
MARYRFYTLDVFTDTAFGGNPLAVVLDADDLSGERMQTIAAEFNLSETVFVLKPAKAGRNRRRLRIFTPQAELPFAGHPTVGASYLLAKLSLVESSAAAPVMVLEEGVGDMPVEVRFGNGAAESTRMSVPRMPERGPEPPSRAQLAAMLSLAEADLLPGHAAYSCGVPFLFLPVRDRAAIARIKLRTDLWEKLLSGWWAKSVFPFTTDTVAQDAQVHARMFAPAMGVAEDPATGSAASALAGLLHDQDPRDGARRWLIEQGFEMGRPSLIELEADAVGGRVTAVRVGGRSVLMSEGWIDAG